MSRDGVDVRGFKRSNLSAVVLFFAVSCSSNSGPDMMGSAELDMTQGDLADLPAPDWAGDAYCQGDASIPCYGGPDETRGTGECKVGTQFCNNGMWGGCTGEVKPVADSGLDHRFTNRPRWAPPQHRFSPA